MKTRNCTSTITRRRSNTRPKAACIAWLLAPTAIMATPPYPDVEGVGSRYLAVTPDSWGNNVAIEVLGLDGTSFGWEDVSCVAAWVQADGTLGGSPVYQSYSTWGTVYVHDAEIVPNAYYAVRVKDQSNGQVSAAIGGQTYRFGDTDNDGIIECSEPDDDDVACILAAFGNSYSGACTPYSADLTGPDCVCDQNTDLDDLLAVLSACDDEEYSDSCELPCE